MVVVDSAIREEIFDPAELYQSRLSASETVGRRSPSLRGYRRLAVV